MLRVAEGGTESAEKGKSEEGDNIPAEAGSYAKVKWKTIPGEAARGPCDGE